MAVIDVIAVSGIKGGIGRSTVTACTGMRLAARGVKVGLLDLDFANPCLPALLEISERPLVIDGRMRPVAGQGVQLFSVGSFFCGEDLVVWTGPNVRGAIHQSLHDVDWSGVDVLLVDFPPGLSELHVEAVRTLNNLRAIHVQAPSLDARMATDTFLREAGVESILQVVNKGCEIPVDHAFHNLTLPAVGSSDRGPNAFLSDKQFAAGIDAVVDWVECTVLNRHLTAIAERA